MFSDSSSVLVITSHTAKKTIAFHRVERLEEMLTASRLCKSSSELNRKHSSEHEFWWGREEKM